MSQDPIRFSAGGAQFGLAVSSTAVTLTVPGAARKAEIYVRTASVVFTRDGTTPTATLGFQAEVGDIIMLHSKSEMTNFKVIRQAADATIDVEYFTS